MTTLDPDTPTPSAPAAPDPLARVGVWGAVGGIALLLVAAVVGWLVDGRAGLLGAVLGIGVPLAFFGVTVLTALLTRRLSPGAMGATVLASWIVKMAALIGVLVLMDGSQAWSRPVFAVCFGLAVPAWLGFEAWVVIKTRQPYTAPAS